MPKNEATKQQQKDAAQGASKTATVKRKPAGQGFTGPFGDMARRFSVNTPDVEQAVARLQEGMRLAFGDDSKAFLEIKAEGISLCDGEANVIVDEGSAEDVLRSLQTLAEA